MKNFVALVALVAFALLCAAPAFADPQDDYPDCAVCQEVVTWVKADMSTNGDSAADAMDVVCAKAALDISSCQAVVEYSGQLLVKALEENSLLNAAQACESVELCQPGAEENCDVPPPQCSCSVTDEDGVVHSTATCEDGLWHCPTADDYPNARYTECYGGHDGHHGGHGEHHHDGDDNSADEQADNTAALLFLCVGSLMMLVCCMLTCRCIRRRKCQRRMAAHQAATAAAMVNHESEMRLLATQMPPVASAPVFYAPSPMGSANPYMSLYPVVIQTPNGPMLAHPVPMPAPNQQQPSAPVLSAAPVLPALQASQHLRS